ncbi:endolytic transglycosylase MltG [Actinomadura macrotermitis]|uniref:Endolytic murein transglycosylase n=1 Tax=Actinomadura macrotermitis TaxID=2585200 RepID=A0A7K0CAK3_9ACTN|nr:endolytic transglycosylase MltG [Actinomadura macrotermitis]MQY09794.1 Endolytic murein transglycosylase [Actinomadura macrotermitis]
MSDLDLFAEPGGRGGPQAEEPLSRRAQRRNRRKQQRRRRKGSAAFLFALAFIVAVFGTAGVFGFAWLDNRMHPPDYSGPGAGNVSVQIKEGATGASIATTLQEHDVVKSVRGFMKVYAKETRASSIQPGYYQMRLRMSSQAAMAMLLDPRSRAGSQIIIPEGQRAYEIYALMSKKTGIPVRTFENAAKNRRALGLPSYAQSVEGYLYPGRYDLSPNATAPQILKQMVARYNQEAASTGLEAKARAAHLSPAALVNLASLIQAEGGKPEDLPKISRVLYNRIKAGMPFGFDTTILYYLKKRTLTVTEQETKIQTPWNTYINKGLPPGPICNPGPDAIEAALKPENGDWLYFVATDPSRKITKFASTEDERKRLVAEFRAWQKAHPGN